MVKDLQELSEKAFTYKNKLQQLTKDIDEFAKADDKKLSFGKIMRIIEEFTKKYKDLIAPKTSKIELGFQLKWTKSIFM
jgi:uncharacterized FlaG/YvyC family protein